MLTEQEIEQYTTHQIYTKYQNYIKNYEVNINPLKRWCPNPKCTEVITLETTTDQTAVCEKCGFEICTLCNRTVHIGISCDQVNMLF